MSHHLEAMGTAQAKLDMKLIAAPALKLSACIIGRTPAEVVLVDILWYTFLMSLPILEPFELLSKLSPLLLYSFKVRTSANLATFTMYHKDVH